MLLTLQFPHWDSHVSCFCLFSNVTFEGLDFLCLQPHFRTWLHNQLSSTTSLPKFSHTGHLIMQIQSEFKLLNQKASSQQKAAQTSWRTPTKSGTAVHSHSNATLRRHFQPICDSRTGHSQRLLIFSQCSPAPGPLQASVATSCGVQPAETGSERLCEVILHLILWKDSFQTTSRHL